MPVYFSRRKAVISGIAACTVPIRAFGQQRLKTWSRDNINQYSQFVPRFVSTYPSEVECSTLALIALVTFAGQNQLPVRLFDHDRAFGRFDRSAGTKRWIIYDPRKDDWKSYRDYIRVQFGATNVIDNSSKISATQAGPGDLLMTEYPSGEYTGHTRVLVEMRYDVSRRDFWTVRYEGSVPAVIPVRKEGWLKDVANLYENSPRRWNFAQFNNL